MSVLEPLSKSPFVEPGPPGPSREPLSTAARRGILALVIFFHVGGGWALTQVESVKLVVGDVAPMEVRIVPAEAAAKIEIEEAEPPPPVELRPPPPPELATIVEPPPRDLPPP
jgi:protein TonB